jgi:chromosome segregation ATPase
MKPFEFVAASTILASYWFTYCTFVQIVRDVFTFGFGELGDWGGINAAIDQANMLIASCEENARACHNGLQQAQGDLQRIQNELSNYQSLRDRLDGYQPRALEQERLANALRNQLNTVQNNALDVSRYLSVLAAKSSTVQLELPAQELAGKVLALQQSMDVARPQGLLWDRPHELQRTLEAIASSPVLAIDAGDMM